MDSQALLKLSSRPPQQVPHAHVTDTPIKTLDAKAWAVIDASDVSLNVAAGRGTPAGVTSVLAECNLH